MGDDLVKAIMGVGVLFALHVTSGGSCLAAAVTSYMRRLINLSSSESHVDATADELLPCKATK